MNNYVLKYKIRCEQTWANIVIFEKEKKINFKSLSTNTEKKIIWSRYLKVGH